MLDAPTNSSDKTKETNERPAEQHDKVQHEAQDELRKRYENKDKEPARQFEKEANASAERSLQLPHVKLVGADGKDVTDKVDGKADQSKEVPTGLTGLLKSPDGKQEYAVVDGKIYSPDKKLYGTVEADGTIKKDSKDAVGTDANSDLTNWKFKGTEDGKPRAFDCSNDMSSGKLFVPGSDGKPVQYDVRMGMVIDHKNGEQIGTFKPPTETPDGALVGGSIKLAGTDTEVPLTDLKSAVFDVKVMGQTGIEGRNVQGISLGPTETQADGSTKPGVGGLFNVQQAREAEAAKVEKAEDTKSEHGDRNVFSKAWNHATGTDDAEKSEYNAQMSESKAVDKILDKALTTGEIYEGSLSFVKQSTDLKNAEGADSLIAMKKSLDTQAHVLEDLPKDTSTINGIVKIPSTSTYGRQVELTIKNGEILSADGTKSIGKIENAQGELSLYNPTTKQNEKLGMKDLSGAVWNMEYKNAEGKDQKVDWVSMGSEGGILSVADLRNRSKGEIGYAQEFDRQSDSDDSQEALERTQKLDKTFNERLNKIADQGFPEGFTPKDLSYLSEGPKRWVRDSTFQEATEQPDEKKIEIPNIATDADAQKVNGQLRLGSDAYQIKNGNLYKLTEHDHRTDVAKEPSGKLGPGYNVVLDGQDPIPLATENRVLLDITIGDSTERKHILGLGETRTASDGTRIEGGLVDVKELERQVAEVKKEADAGNQDYFDNKPYLTGGIANWAMGDTDQTLKDLSANMQSEINIMDKNVDKLFDTGFDTTATTNNQIDGRVQVTQMVMNDVNVTASDTQELAANGKVLQKMTNDAVIIAATTAATAGAGAVIAGAAEAGMVGTTGAYALELGAGAASGAGISAVGRASPNSDLSDNLVSGALTGGTFALGSVGGKAIGSVKDLQALREAGTLKRTGMAMSVEDEAALNTVIGKLAAKGYDEKALKAAYYASKGGQEFTQSVALNSSSAIREHSWDSLSVQSLALGTGALGAGRIVGGGFKSTSAGLLRTTEDSLVPTVLGNGTTAYANAAVYSVNQALDMEKQRIAQDLQIKPEHVSRDLLFSRINWDNVANTMNEAGAVAGITAAGITVADREVISGITSRMRKTENEQLPLFRASAEKPAGKTASEENLTPANPSVSKDQLSLFEPAPAVANASRVNPEQVQAMVNSWRHILSETDLVFAQRLAHAMLKSSMTQLQKNSPALHDQHLDNGIS